MTWADKRTAIVGWSEYGAVADCLRDQGLRLIQATRRPCHERPTPIRTSTRHALTALLTGEPRALGVGCISVCLDLPGTNRLAADVRMLSQDTLEESRDKRAPRDT
jgi:hypothetical protein